MPAMVTRKSAAERRSWIRELLLTRQKTGLSPGNNGEKWQLSSNT